LIGLGREDEVRAAFEEEVEAYGDEPEYRIGVWRVLAQAAPDAGEQWTGRIRAALLDPEAPDRLHAAETTAKLGLQLTGAEQEIVQKMAAASEAPALKAYASWLLANQREDGGEGLLISLLDDDEPVVRLVGAYASMFRKTIAPKYAGALAAAAKAEAEGSPARPFLMAASYVHAPSAEEAAPFEDALLALLGEGEAGAQVRAADAFAKRPSSKATGLLRERLAAENVDVRLSAAHALLTAQ
jgi:SSS family solute:Na+ symporter